MRSILDQQAEQELFDKECFMDNAEKRLVVEWQEGINHNLTVEERANALPLPFAEAMHLLHYSSHTSEDKIRMMSIENKPITKADVLRIFTEELEYNFEKHILPELAKPSTLYMYPKPSEPKMQ